MPQTLGLCEVDPLRPTVSILGQPVCTQQARESFWGGRREAETS